MKIKRKLWLFGIIGFIGFVVVYCDNGTTPHTHDWNWIETSTGVETKTCDACVETDGIRLTLEIGDTGPGGGIIFYVADGQESRSFGFTVEGYSGTTGSFASYTAYYLEAALSTVTDQQWAGANQLIPNLSLNSSDQTDWEIGRGMMNTAIITAHGAANSYTTPAASSCINLTTGEKTDWFLPSRNELELLFQNKGEAGIDISNGYFWSSSQFGNSPAWGQSFVNGNLASNTKSFNANVRAVRAF